MLPYRDWAIVRWARDHRFVIDIAIALVVATVSVIVHFHQRVADGVEFREPSVWSVPLVFSASVPLIWRRTNAIATAYATFGIQAAVEVANLNGPAWVPMVIATYALGSYSSGPRRMKAVAVLTMFLVCFMAFGLTQHEKNFTIWIALAALLWLGMAFFVGDNMRRRRCEIEDLAARADRAERERELLASRRVTEERTRIARELHDIVAHSVSVMVIQATAARRNLQRDRDAAEGLLLNIEQTGRQTMGELRQILGVLRDADGETAPMVPVLCDLDSLVTSIPDLQVRLFRTGSLESVPIGVALAAYRVVQEALTNAHRHAGPNVTVDVEVACTDERVDVRVTDNGRGASTRPDETSGGYGLIGMSERVATFNGTLVTGPRRNGGWEVKATFPLESSGSIRQLTPPVREFVS